MTVIVAQAHITGMSHILRLAAQQEKGRVTTPVVTNRSCTSAEATEFDADFKR